MSFEAPRPSQDHASPIYNHTQLSTAEPWPFLSVYPQTRWISVQVHQKTPFCFEERALLSSC